MKLYIAILIDLFDFTIGRLLFPVPFSGEIVGVAICYLMFGPRAFTYALEAFDPTEQIDAFIPTATIIALAHQREQAA
tara:strand:- start:4762 stop:4995 length:234 start_codon:yes stop_codon:yes gene_type:complete